MPKIEIDGVSVDAEHGTTIIEVADRLKIPIPRFCYHHKLSVAANCRMCLVQVEKSPKALPACATPIVDGMKVWTASKETKAAQQAVMEYLLINHPLDCPICDQGGECELQDVSMQYGKGSSRFQEPKRAIADQNVGALIETEMTRCIQCTRCVRFGSEISGERELGAVGRGEHMEISTYIEHTINSEVSGNIIDLCPVGALTSKPFRFKARSWELKATAGISPHDCIGSTLYWQSLRQTIMRVAPKESEELNEVWLSDRDRFSYEALYHEERLRKPLILKQRWVNLEWDDALRFAVAQLQDVINKHGASEIGILVSPSMSTEEYFLLKKIAHSIGCNNIDHRLRQLDFNDQELSPLYPNLGIDFRSIIDLDTAILIGCNIAKEQPLASIRMRKMVKRGGKICALNCVDYHYNFALAGKIVVPIAELQHGLAMIVKACAELVKYKFDSATATILSNIDVNQAAKSIAESLISGHKRQIFLGHIALMHPQASQIWALANLLAEIIDARCGSFSEGANAAGACITGCIPHRNLNGVANEVMGMDAVSMLQSPVRAYILYGIDPDFDSILGAQAIVALKQAEFVLAINSYQTDTLLDVADMILPLAAPGEYAGTMININGTKQSFLQAVDPYGESKPGWKILRMLGNLLNLDGFKYNTIQDVQQEMHHMINIDHALPKWQKQQLRPIPAAKAKEIIHIAPLPLYAVDAITRRAAALQATKDAHTAAEIHINSKMATYLNVHASEWVLVSNHNNHAGLKLQVVIDDKIANNTAQIYQANSHTRWLGAPYGVLEVRKC